jgi:arylsulfatase A-like enzyme
MTKQTFLKFAQGVLWGMIAWLAFGVLEYAATTIAPLWSYRGLTIAAWHWKLSAVLFGLYALAGMVCGGLGGLLLSRKAEAPATEGGRLQALATATVAAALIANQLAGVIAPFTLLGCVGVIVCAGLGLSSESWRTRLCLFVNPWGATAIILLIGRVADERMRHQAVAFRSAATLGLLGVFAIASLAFARKWPRRRVISAVRPGAVVFGSGILACAGALMLDGGLQAKIAGGEQRGIAGRPNIVLITMDTVRADHLSLYGYDRNTSPNLVKLARSATVYRYAHAAADITLSSHAAMFTGVYASWNGAHTVPRGGHAQPISTNYRTAPQILSGHDYFTAAVVANTAFLQREFGFDRGFQFFDSRSPLQILKPEHEYYLRSGVRRLLGQFVCTAEFDMVVRRAAEINRDAFRVLAQARAARQPFFLFLNYMDAHSPYVPPAPFDTMFPGKDPFMTYAERLQLGVDVASMKKTVTRKQRDHLVSQYDGGIAYLDTQIGKLIRQLKQLGLYDNTLIIITSDHGEAFGEHSFMGHGVSVYEDQVFVPLIIKYPNEVSEQVVDTPVGHVDIFPTILAAAGVKPSGFVQGRSLQEAGSGNRALFSESFPESRLMQLHPRFLRTARAMYSGGLKYIGWGAGKNELYDLAKDPRETQDLCAAGNVRCDELQDQLAEWARSVPPDVAPARKLNPQSLERLKSLGYVQ